MIATTILSASWESYDRRKALAHQDQHIFCPDEPWEFNYLVETIVKAEPYLDEITIMLAVRQSTRLTMAPRPRNHFVEVVASSIRERKEYWAQIVESAAQIGVDN